MILTVFRLMGIDIAVTSAHRTLHRALLQQEYGMTLEALIAAGVFGWLVIGMVMMGLGIW